MNTAPASPYLAGRRPRYVLRTRVRIPAAVEDVFAFFSRPENLGAITPASMGFRITATSGGMQEGALIEYRISIAGVRLRWRTRIDAWEPNRRFVDAQVDGPYACWWHEHRFAADGPHATVMEDAVYYAPPMGFAGRLVHHLFIRRSLLSIFSYRADAIRMRFGGGLSRSCGRARV